VTGEISETPPDRLPRTGQPPQHPYVPPHYCRHWLGMAPACALGISMAWARVWVDLLPRYRCVEQDQAHIRWPCMFADWSELPPWMRPPKHT
jgi:hypothetical protein